MRSRREGGWNIPVLHVCCVLRPSARMSRGCIILNADADADAGLFSKDNIFYNS